MLSQHSASEPYPSLLHVTNSNELPQPPRTIVIAVCMCLGLIGVSGDRSFSSLALEPTMCEAVRQNFGLVLGWNLGHWAYCPHTPSLGHAQQRAEGALGAHQNTLLLLPRLPLWQR